MLTIPCILGLLCPPQDGGQPEQAQAAPMPPRPLMVFEAPRELGSDAQRESTLDEVQAFGVRAVRHLVYWRAIAANPGSERVPSGARYTNWGPVDRLVESARGRGLIVTLTVTGPGPDWATRGAGGANHPNAAEFQRFVTEAGRRYGESVRTWSVWNEPNHPQFLGPQFRKRRPYSPRLYRSLFQAAVRGLRASGNGDDTVLAGETAPRGTGRVVAPLRFVREMLCLNGRYRKTRRCAKLPADGYAHHAYTTRVGPRFRPPNRDDVTIGVLSRLTRALDRAARARAVRRRMPIYLTEFGIQSKPDPYVGVSLTRQAEYLAIAERMAQRNRRVRSFSQYLMRDDSPRPGPRFQRYSGFESGLRRSNGKAKPSYHGFRLPLAADKRSRTRVSLWGLVRPHPQETRVEILYRDSGRRKSWRRLALETTNGKGVWTRTASYRKGRRYRVKWTAPDGRTFRGVPVRAY